MTGEKTKSAARRIKRVFTEQVKIDVRRVVGRENSNSQMISLLLLALACGRGGQDRVWSNGGEGEAHLVLSSKGAGLVFLCRL